MKMAFLLDTNVFGELSRPKPSRQLTRRFERHVDEIVTASIVVHEIWFAIERLPRSRKREHLERFMAEIVSGVRVLPYGERAARWHAAERARLAAAGRPAPQEDGQIAAICAIHDATLVTANVAHFAPFKGLVVENWLD